MKKILLIAAMVLGFAVAASAQPRAIGLRGGVGLSYEERMDWWRKGYSDQTRLWIDDAYMIGALQTQAFRLTGDVKYVERAAKRLFFISTDFRNQTVFSTIRLRCRSIGVVATAGWPVRCRRFSSICRKEANSVHV